jgi:hypothetical protein
MIAKEGGTGAARRGTMATPWNPRIGADLADLHILTSKGNEAAKERPAFSERKFQQKGYSIVSIFGKPGDGLGSLHMEHTRRSAEGGDGRKRYFSTSWREPSRLDERWVNFDS